MEELYAISPIDGRYYGKLQQLSQYFSEFALIKKRLYVELLYLRELGKGDFIEVYDKFSLDDAQKIKEIEKTTNHDVKAVEYYIKEKVPKDIKEFVHYGLTSEDINNLSYSLLVKEFIETTYTSKLQELLTILEKISVENRAVAMLAHTHGQPASPTTMGKEFFIFYNRLKDQFSKLQNIKLRGKLNGASGNYNALVVAEPQKDWIEFSKKFINKLGLEPNLYTTQIEPNDTLVELFHCIKRINNIVLDLDIDIWLYISMDYFKIRKKEGEVGSSTMPHKVNPIDFENSEGNIKLANSQFDCFESLQVSRLQRDLSNSTIMRNIGVAFSHSILAYDSVLNGLGKLIPNPEKIESDLESHPEVLSEAVQTVLRKYGEDQAYERMKSMCRGNLVTLNDLHDFIDSLKIPAKDKKRLKDLRPKDYIGLANDLVKI
ncbi:MAG: adenylosuccinate lyase [archaeon]